MRSLGYTLNVNYDGGTAEIISTGLGALAAGLDPYFHHQTPARLAAGATRTEKANLVDIEQARSDYQIDAARELFRAFVAWHRATHVQDRALIDRYFDEGAFEAELRGLPGAYAPPKGSLLVAFADGTPAGCVALRDLGEGCCEMKRMFVPAARRGTGIGRRLADAVIAEARAAGYHRMRLNTGPRQTAAIALYESLGFRRISPYYELPEDLSNVLLFFERDL